MKQVIQPDKCTTLALKHYPIITCFFKEYSLFELFDRLLPKKNHDSCSHSQCILLLLCDCLSSTTLSYFYTDTLSDIDLGIIIGPDVKKEHFSDFAIGETLEAIAEFGGDKLFAQVLEHIRLQGDFDMSHLYAESKSFSTAGNYYKEDDDPTYLHVTFHAKNERPDLDLWAVLMIFNGQGIPVAMKTLDENSSDRKTITAEMKTLLREQEEQPEDTKHEGVAMTVKKGFRFLRDGHLKITPVYLKTPKGIQALSFVLCFSLMVYASIENKLRTSLARAGETIQIQDSGPANYRNNARPTLTKVFAMFNNLHTVFLTLSGSEKMVIAPLLPPKLTKVLHFLGPLYEQAFKRE